MFAVSCRNRLFRYPPTGDNGSQSKQSISLLPLFSSLCFLDFLCFLLHEILRAAKNKLAARLMARGDLLQSRKSGMND
jgi:hypothetical protein